MSKDKRYSIQDFDESLLGAMPFAVDIVDQGLNILYMNEELEAKVGKEAIGRKCYKIYKDDGVQCLGCPLAKPMNIGEVNFIEVGDALGGRAVRITHRAIEIKGKTAILEVFEDITERKAMRELEKNYEFQLLNKEKLASIGELAAGIVHNLKNPLNAIIGFAETVQRKRPDVEYIDYILDAGRDMDKIIENILYKTRQEQSTHEKPIDINKMLSNGLTFLEANPLFKSKVQKNIEFEASLPKINGVYSDFSQSFSNIIKNALDAIYNSDTKILTVKTWHDERYIYVMVGDTGEGIAEEKITKIFEPHFTTKATADEAGKDEPVGTGLGLYMVRELLKKYHAEYDIKSRIGKGTTFTVMFPIVRILVDIDEKQAYHWFNGGKTAV